MSTQGGAAKPSEELFTDFGGRVKARLNSVIPRRSFSGGEGRFFGSSSRYECRIKVEYQRDVMRILEEGMIVAVENFRSTPDSRRYTLLELTKILPEHFGLRGLSDHSYYPMQFEIIERAVPDWSTDDRSAMIVHADAVPINYDLVIEAGRPEFAKGFSFPKLGEQANILSKWMIDKMYNESVLEKLENLAAGSATSVLDAAVGKINMFRSEGSGDIPLFLDLESLVRHHFGVFAFTGGGKSNLVANLVRKVIRGLPDSRVIVFDVSCEYPFLLLDLLVDEDVPSIVITEQRVSSAEQLYNSIVKPKEFEDREEGIFEVQKLMEMGRVGHFYEPPSFEMPTFGGMLSELQSLGGSIDSAPGQAAQEIRLRIKAVMDELGVGEDDVPDGETAERIGSEAENVLEERSLRKSSNLYTWATAIRRMPQLVELGAEHRPSLGRDEYNREKICDLLLGETRLICLSISDPEVVRQLAIDISKEILGRRRRQFSVRPYILFVFDEAQEFIPQLQAGGSEAACSKAIERLLRQGRKYGLGCCVSTQRIAYLNTNALQQLHTYFVGTLPRPYDRTVVSDIFAIDLGILDKTLEFKPGEWLVSSYSATGLPNVPIFIQAENTEDVIADLFQARRLA